MSTCPISPVFGSGKGMTTSSEEAGGRKKVNEYDRVVETTRDFTLEEKKRSLGMSRWHEVRLG